MNDFIQILLIIFSGSLQNKFFHIWIIRLLFDQGSVVEMLYILVAGLVKMNCMAMKSVLVCLRKQKLSRRVEFYISKQMKMTFAADQCELDSLDSVHIPLSVHLL